jgi:hypothetical protein
MRISETFECKHVLIAVGVLEHYLILAKRSPAATMNDARELPKQFVLGDVREFLRESQRTNEVTDRQGSGRGQVPRMDANNPDRWNVERFDGAPEGRGHRVLVDLAQLANSIEGYRAGKKLIDEPVSEKEESAGAVVRLRLDLVVARGRERVIRIAEREHLVMWYQAVRDLVRLGPPLFRRNAAVDQDAAALGHPKRAELSRTNRGKDPRGVSKHLSQADLKTMDGFIQDAVIAR